MKVRWERDLERTSLVLAEEGEGEAGGFETKMVCVGGVPGLLPMTVRQMDNKTEYVYDVTARQPLSEHLQGRLLDRGSLTEILDAVLQVIEGLAAFLLDSGHLQYASDRIFVKGGFRDLRFCYLPTQTTTMREGFYGLVMELLAKTDPKDRAAIVLGYRFAHELQGENVTLQELRELLHGEGDLSANASGETVVNRPGRAAWEGFGGSANEDFHAEMSERFGKGAKEGFGRIAKDEFQVGMSERFGKVERSSESVHGDLDKAGGEAFGSFDTRDSAWQKGLTLSQIGAWRKRGGSASGTGMAARLGINKRTILIVGIGAAVLLAAYLALHTEVLGVVIENAKENPILLSVPLVLAAGIVLFIVIRRKKKEKIRASNADEDIFGIGKPDVFLNASQDSRGSGTVYGFQDVKSNGSRYDFSEASQGAKGGGSPYEFSKASNVSRGNSSAYAFPEVLQENAGCTVASTNKPRYHTEERVLRTPLHQNAFGDEGMKKSDEESRQNGPNPNGNLRFVQNGEDDSETCLLRPAKTEAMVWLLPTGKAEAFGEIVLQKDYNIIGKQSEMVEVVLPSPVISRVHAHICRKEGTWMVADLSSRNGTFLNDEPLMPMQDMPIKDGDTLRFADLGYVFKGK